MTQEPNNNSTGERMKDSKRRRTPTPPLIPMPEPEPRVSIKAGKKKRKKMKKPERRVNRAMLIVLLVLLFIAGAFAGLYYMTIVDSITVTGCERYSADAVINLSGLYTGKNIFLYDLNAAEKSIETDPYLECVGIERVFPSGLRINVNERHEFAAVFTSAGAACIIDKEGYVLEVGRVSGTEGLIPIYGLGAMGFSVGTAIDNDKSLLRPYTVMEMLRSIVDRTWVIGSIDISNTSSVKLITPEGITVMLGDSVLIPQKIERMFRVLDKVDPEKASGTVLYVNANGTTDISFATPAPTDEPTATPEPLPTNVPDDSPEPAETDAPDNTEDSSSENDQ